MEFSLSSVGRSVEDLGACSNARPEGELHRTVEVSQCHRSHKSTHQENPYTK